MPVRYDDWGVLSRQWAGLRSVSTSVCGVHVHYVRADAASGVASDAELHLLVPPMTGSASMWIDLVPHLRALGPVISVDLPGTFAGHTGSPYRHGPRAVEPASLVQHARRPGWTPRPIGGVGHLLPVEAPDLYTQAVRQWLA